jgi:hypothetical protein
MNIDPPVLSNPSELKIILPEMETEPTAKVSKIARTERVRSTMQSIPSNIRPLNSPLALKQKEYKRTTQLTFLSNDQDFKQRNYFFGQINPF